MKNILLLAATETEITPLIQHLSSSWDKVKEHIYRKNGVQVTLKISGVGVLATAYQLLKCLLSGSYEFVLQAGIAGAYNRELKIRDVVWVQSECLADLRVEDNEEYIDFFDLGLIKHDTIPFSKRRLNNPLTDKELGITGVKSVAGLTVSTVTGNNSTVKYMKEKYNADVESTEGAALHYICILEDIPFVQVRSISNFVEARNRKTWDIEGAVNDLNYFLIEYLEGR